MNISKETIVDLEEKLLVAITKSDVQFIDKILHENLRFLIPNGQVITKEMDIASHQAGAMIVERITPTLEDVTLADDIAVVVIVYDTKGIMLGTPIEGRFRYLRVWKKFSDGIKVIAGSCFKLETEK